MFSKSINIARAISIAFILAISSLPFALANDTSASSIDPLGITCEDGKGLIHWNPEGQYYYTSETSPLTWGQDVKESVDCYQERAQNTYAYVVTPWVIVEVDGEGNIDIRPNTSSCEGRALATTLFMIEGDVIGECVPCTNNTNNPNCQDTCYIDPTNGRLVCVSGDARCENNSPPQPSSCKDPETATTMHLLYGLLA